MSDRHADPDYKAVSRHKGKRMGTMWSDWSGSGDVTLSDAFDAMTHVERADILKDVIFHLENEYARVIEEMTNG